MDTPGIVDATGGEDTPPPPGWLAAHLGASVQPTNAGPVPPPPPKPGWLAQHLRAQTDATAVNTGRPDTPIPNNTIGPLTDPAELAMMRTPQKDWQQAMAQKATLARLAANPFLAAIGGPEEEGAELAADAAKTFGDRWAIMTAENPGSIARTPAFNAARNAELVADLKARGIEHTPVAGYFEGNKENSFLLHGVHPDDAAELGRKYNQSSVLTSEGLHDLSNDTLAPLERVRPTKEGDVAYTDTPSGRFTMDLAFDKQVPKPMSPEKLLTRLRAMNYPGVARDVPEAGGFPGIRADSALAAPAASAAKGVFDLSKLGPDLPAGYDASRAPIKRPGPKADLSALSNVPARFADTFTPNAERVLNDNPQAAGWYDMSQLRDAMQQHDPENGAKDFRQFMQFMGPTSTGTTTPQNIRQASMFFKLWKNGELNPEDLKNGTLALPPGYSNRRQASVNSGVLNILQNGSLDPIEQPKTARYANQLGGENWGSGVLDMHVGRQVGEPGQIRDATGGGYTQGVGFPTPGYAKNQIISSSPANTQYPGIEDHLISEAQRLGVPPASYQAAGWVGGGAKTGVADASPMLKVLNDRLQATADKFGYPSALHALHAFMRGETPLWSMVPGSLGAAAGMQGARAGTGHTGAGVDDGGAGRQGLVNYQPR